MKFNLYAFKDKHQGFLSVNPLLNDAIAYRNLTNVLKKENDFSANPEDYSLWRLGTIDFESGIIESKVEFMCDFQSIVDSLKH